MKSRDGNRLIRLSLLLAGMVFLLIFVVFVLKAWNSYFHQKPKEWLASKEEEEKEITLAVKNILFISSYDISNEIFMPI